MSFHNRLLKCVIETSPAVANTILHALNFRILTSCSKNARNVIWLYTVVLQVATDLKFLIVESIDRLDKSPRLMISLLIMMC